MWREEVGIFEMLFSYIGEIEQFNGWTNWRSLLVEILSCHEHFRHDSIPCPPRMQAIEMPPEEHTTKQDVILNTVPDGIRDVSTSWGNNDGEIEEVKADGAPFEELTIVGSYEVGHVKREEENGLDEATAPDCNLVTGFGETQSLGTRPDSHTPTLLQCVDSDIHSASEFPRTEVNEPILHPVQHICSECGKGFLTEVALKRHFSTSHTRGMFLCQLCGRSFTLKSNLRRHEKIHGGQPRHRCDVCGKAFYQSNNLQSHRRIHSGERPFACSVCFKSFRQKRNVKDHMLRTHFRDSD